MSSHNNLKISRVSSPLAPLDRRAAADPAVGAGTSHPQLAQLIARRLGLPLGSSSIVTLPSGELSYVALTNNRLALPPTRSSTMKLPSLSRVISRPYRLTSIPPALCILLRASQQRRVPRIGPRSRRLHRRDCEFARNGHQWSAHGVSPPSPQKLPVILSQAHQELISEWSWSAQVVHHGTHPPDSVGSSHHRSRVRFSSAHACRPRPSSWLY